MTFKECGIQNQILFRKIRLISNPLRFRIIELTLDNQLSITELSSKLRLAYNKCADYVRMLENLDLIKKTKVKKEVKVKSKISLNKDRILFSN